MAGGSASRANLNCYLGIETLAQERITWLDELIDGKTFISGDRFTLADILLFCFMKFGTDVGQPINTDNGT